jgi:hypothetical protein
MQKTYLSLPDIRESDNFITELSINFMLLLQHRLYRIS